MVDLMLQHDGQKPLRFKSQWIAVTIQPFNKDALGAFHICAKVGYAEAAFIFGDNLSLFFDDLWIDEDMQLPAVLFVRNIIHKHALIRTDLYSSQADTWRLVHRGGHQIDKFLQSAINLFHRTCFVFQEVVWVCQYIKNAHWPCYLSLNNPPLYRLCRHRSIARN